jgi:hypothetical protein
MNRWRHRILRVMVNCGSAALMAWGLLACGGGGEGAAPPPAVPTAPTITAPPAAATVTAGTAATFSVTASGSAPLAYQWQRDGTNITGATTSTYTVSAPDVADSGTQFRVVISNSAGTVTSAAAALTVTELVIAPTIAVQPQSGNALDGTSGSFSVAAAGTAPLTYTWRRNGAVVADATAATYTTPALTLADTGATYSVVVSNAAGSTTSANATITVNPAPPVILTAPASAQVAAGQAATFSVAAGGTATLVYQWRRNGSDLAGAAGASYTTPAAAVADSGARYSVVVSNVAGSVTSAEAVLTVGATPLAPAISTAPQNAVVFEGQPATFGVSATGTAPLAYQWRRNGADVSGATAASYTTPVTTTADNGARYSVRVANGAGSAVSAEAVLTVNPAVTPLLGRAFAAAQALEVDDNEVGDRFTAIDDAGRVTVLFQKANGARNVLYTVRGTANTAGVAPSWTAPTPIDLLNGSPLSTMGNSPEYALKAAPGGDVVAYWYHNAPCTASTYKTTGNCRYYYYARYAVASNTWGAPTLLGDSPSGSYDMHLNDRGDVVFLGNSWVRSGASSYTTSLALFMRTAADTGFRRQLLGDQPLGDYKLAMDGGGNLLMAAEYRQNATTDVVAYRGTAASGLGTPQVLDTRGAAASLRLSKVGLNGQQVVIWTQNNGVQTTTFGATSATPTAPFTVTDLGYNINSNLTLFDLFIDDDGQSAVYEVGFFARRRINWSPVAGWSGLITMPDNELYARSSASNRRGDLLLWDTNGRWGTYDASRNVMVQSFQPAPAYVLGVSTSNAGLGRGALSMNGLGVLTLQNKFDVLPTPAQPAGDGRNVTNLWGAFFK